MRRARRFGSATAGAAAIRNLLWLPALLGFGGLAIDTANAYRARAMLQATADAAALAGAHGLPDAATAEALARAYVAANLPDAAHAPYATRIALGLWNADARSFEADPKAASAIEVTLTHDGAAGSGLPTLMLGLFGMEAFDVTARATAAARRAGGAGGAHGAGPCTAGGLISAGRLSSGTNNDYADGFCLHGEKGVSIGSNNDFAPGVQVSMADLGDFEERNNNRGVEAALHERSLQLTLPELIAPTIASMRAGMSDLPDWITSRQVVNRLPNRPVSGTLYVVRGDAEIRSNRSLAQVAIVAEGAIGIGANTDLIDVILAAEEGIAFGSNITIGVGEGSFCEFGEYRAYLFSGGDVTFGSNLQLAATQITALGRLEMNANIDQLPGVYAEIVGGIDYNSNLDFWGCETPLTSLWPASTLPRPQAEAGAVLGARILR